MQLLGKGAVNTFVEIQRNKNKEYIIRTELSKRISMCYPTFPVKYWKRVTACSTTERKA